MFWKSQFLAPKYLDYNLQAPILNQIKNKQVKVCNFISIVVC